MGNPEISPVQNTQESIKENTYPRDFFDLQLQFAQRVAEINQISIENALLRYTSFYRRFECGHAFDKQNPVWQEYIAGLAHTDSKLDWTYDFYLKTQDGKQKSPEESQYIKIGCFTLVPNGENVDIHFDAGSDTSGKSPLGKERVEMRKQELKELFQRIKTEFPETKTVRGHSWLYNIDAYRRLFPDSYTESRKVAMSYRSASLWGQFVNRNRQLKPEIAEQFRAKLANPAITDPVEFFPMKVMNTKGAIKEFYEFYGIK